MDVEHWCEMGAADGAADFSPMTDFDWGPNHRTALVALAGPAMLIAAGAGFVVLGVLLG